MGLLIFAIIAIALSAVVAKIFLGANHRDYETTRQEVAAKMSDADLLETVNKQLQMVELMIQSKMVGDERTYNTVINNAYDGPLPERRSDGGWLSIYDNLRILKIAGINHRQGIGRYVGRMECALVPEPKNEFDPNAIKIVAEDGHHLGYIPSGQTDMVRSMACDEFPYRCECVINEAEDENDGHRFYYGFVYIVRKDKGA